MGLAADHNDRFPATLGIQNTLKDTNWKYVDTSGAIAWAESLRCQDL